MRGGGCYGKKRKAAALHRGATFRDPDPEMGLHPGQPHPSSRFQDRCQDHPSQRTGPRGPGWREARGGQPLCHRRQREGLAPDGPAKALAVGAQGGGTRRRADPRIATYVRFGGGDGRRACPWLGKSWVTRGPRQPRTSPTSPTIRSSARPTAWPHLSRRPWTDDRAIHLERAADEHTACAARRANRMESIQMVEGVMQALTSDRRTTEFTTSATWP